MLEWKRRCEEMELEIRALKVELGHESAMNRMDEDDLKDPDYDPGELVGQGIDQKLDSLLNYQQKGCVKKFNPVLATFAMELIVNQMIPAASVGGVLEALQSNFELWPGRVVPTPRYFQSIRDTLGPLNDEQARR